MRTPAPPFRKIDGRPSDVVFSESDGWDEAMPSHAAPRPPSAGPSFSPSSAAPQPELPPERPLMSAATSAAVDSAFNALAQTVLVQNARTLEDLVREMLRPMLKSWLDDNLPQMVERLVRAEIERVSRGRS
ncbi:hypothetical protein RHODGE_RHODGE_00878 [Rhodoplanes serenus]|uniref:DUF2497 domain-containing protein n=3 Tax=Rhodoplanes TaxID=29407 RepID=A0A3S4FB48_9BRAD|nr:hypothetical protein RHODGE_RHODGE_00878 [Rhodoplanes serenus]